MNNIILLRKRQQDKTFTIYIIIHQKINAIFQLHSDNNDLEK